MQLVKDKHIILNISGSFCVDCSKEDHLDPMTEGMIMMWGVFAEMERNIISQRVKSGMKNALSKGKRIGRPEITKNDLPDKFWKFFSMYQCKQITVTEFANVMNCSRPTIYKYIALATEKATA